MAVRVHLIEFIFMECPAVGLGGARVRECSLCRRFCLWARTHACVPCLACAHGSRVRVQQGDLVPCVYVGRTRDVGAGQVEACP